MCECGGELVECVCGDRCCDDCGCRTVIDDDLHSVAAPSSLSGVVVGGGESRPGLAEGIEAAVAALLSDGGNDFDWFDQLAQSVRHDATTALTAAYPIMVAAVAEHIAGLIEAEQASDHPGVPPFPAGRWYGIHRAARVARSFAASLEG